MAMTPIHIRAVKGVDAEGKSRMQYPDFNRLPAAVRGGVDWCIFIDSQGIGMHYDKSANLGKGGTEEWCGTIVPQAFADAAVALFPDDVKIITDVQWEAWYDTKHAVEMETEILDKDVLVAIEARVSLEAAGVAPPPSAEILALRARCLDPNDQECKGIRKNLRKKWADRKVQLDSKLRPAP